MNLRGGTLQASRPAFSIQPPPVAAVLAVLLVPMLCRFQGDAGAWSSQASAAAVGGSKAIIQNLGIVPIAADLTQLENDSVQAYLGLHDLPQSDSTIVYTYGRRDLRSAIRGTTQYQSILARLTALARGMSSVASCSSRVTRTKSMF
jgi:hypothetical protein